MGSKKVFPLDWASKFLNNTDFDNLNTFYGDEITAAKYIYGYKLARDSVKAYLKCLETIVHCNVNESDKLRREANSLYKRTEKLKEAAIKYTQAIFKAPSASSSLARAHANRAVVLYKLNAYKAAYEDCVCALNFNHPNSDTLLKRQAIIAQKLTDGQKLQDYVSCFPSLTNVCSRKVKNVTSPINTSETPALSKITKFKKIKV